MSSRNDLEIMQSHMLSFRLTHPRFGFTCSLLDSHSHLGFTYSLLDSLTFRFILTFRLTHSLLDVHIPFAEAKPKTKYSNVFYHNMLTDYIQMI